MSVRSPLERPKRTAAAADPWSAVAPRDIFAEFEQRAA
jgi:hypothetical protein